MAAEKQVIAPGKAYSGMATTAAIAAETKPSARPDTSSASEGEGTAGSPSDAKPKWKFVKSHGVADKLRFKDGSSFQFRLIERNDGDGYMSTSYVVTDDEKLASNLREAAKNGFLGVQEVNI